MNGVRRIFVVGMAGAGNLGDDLISVCLCEDLHREWPDASIGVLMHEYSHCLRYPKQAELYAAPQLHELSTMHARNKAIREFLKDTDLLVIGGGGLLQDVHYPFNAHKWLSYSAACDRSRCRVWGLGLGAGPIQHRHTSMYLRQKLPRFDVVQVRDQHSAALLESLGVHTVVGPDVVAGSEVGECGLREAAKDAAIGCCLRAWPGLDVEAVAELLAQLASEDSCTIRMFTLEYYEPNNVEDYELHRRIGAKLEGRGIRVEQYCYRKTQWHELCLAFCSVRRAVAMRLHANVLWQKVHVPVLPIVYSPKVSSLYGRRDDSLSMVHVEEIRGLRAERVRFESIASFAPYTLPNKSDDALHYNGDTVRAAVVDAVYGMADLAYRAGAGVWRRLAGSTNEHGAMEM